METTRLLRGGALLFSLLLIALLGYFLLLGSAPPAQRQATEDLSEIGDTGTVQDGLGSDIEGGGIIGDPSGAPVQTAPTPLPPEEDPAAEAPLPSARAALYEEYELERLRQDLDAELTDAMALRELRKQARRSPIGTSSFRFEDPSATPKTEGAAPESARVSAPLSGPLSGLPAPSASLIALTNPDLAEITGQASGAAPAAATPQTGPQTGPQDGYTPHRLTRPRSPYELRRGTVIPGILTTAINSDIPGPISGTVRLDVYDTVTGHYLLIPAGARLFGRYEADITYGQKRLGIVWTDLVFPNGDALRLEGQEATDNAGRAGFADQRRGNFWRTLGGNLLYTIVDAGENTAQARLEEALGGGRQETDTPGDLAARFGAGLAAGGTSAASVFNRQQSQLKPTLRIRSGYRFNILVARDLILEPRQ